MPITQTVRDRLEPLTRSSFAKIKVNEFRPGYDLIGLKYLRDKAGNERNLRELYRNRAPYELLQNADDAGAVHVTFILREDGLAFAHDGSWFTVQNFRSLADGWSDKDPNQCIGHKGLGFRSVLDITPAPHLVKVDAKQFLAIKFSWALNNGHIHETFLKNPALKDQYEEWTRHGQMACPIMAIPGEAKKDSLGTASSVLNGLLSGNYGSEYTTMFWFPSKDSVIDPKALKELGPVPIVASEDGRGKLLKFLDKEVSVLLPFLQSVKAVDLYDRDQLIGAVNLRRDEDDKKSAEIVISTQVYGERRKRTFFMMRFDPEIPFTVKNRPDTPKAVKVLTKAGFALAVELQNGQPVPNVGACFHVYFPTGERTGTNFIIHGDLFVKPDRTHLMPGPYNEWLLGEIAGKAANQFLTELLNRYRPLSVFSALSPSDPNWLNSDNLFLPLFADALKHRALPYIPTSNGVMGATQVAVPPVVDREGFWEGHFSDFIEEVLPNKKAFLLPDCDSHGTRSFFRLAGLTFFEVQSIVDFIERSSSIPRAAKWWYECYSYMAGNERLYSLGRDFFAGRKLIPVSDKLVAPTPADNKRVICLPPSSDRSSQTVPPCFSEVFCFLDSGLASLLERGPDTVRSWVLDRFGIAKFEATELLPRAIRGIVGGLYSGDRSINPDELAEAWLFIKSIIDGSRTILSSDFWEDIGRFPLPRPTAEGTSHGADGLVPAFLAYWPDSALTNWSLAEI
jgi:hypothetical protein